MNENKKTSENISDKSEDLINQIAKSENTVDQQASDEISFKLPQQPRCQTVVSNMLNKANIVVNDNESDY